MNDVSRKGSLCFSGFERQNSGILCAYYPEPDRFITISGIFCPYLTRNGPKRGNFQAIKENSDIKFLYFF